MPRQAIKQAECTECGVDGPSFTKTDKTFLNDSVSTIEYDIKCTECGQASTVSVDREGTNAGDGVTHENASWNQSNEE
jgi:hypothetical protein